ncbi:MAG: molybdate ABC transporter permease subunit [Anaerolineae bacterium]
MNLHPLYLSLQVAAVATAIVFVIGLALALLFARRDFPGKSALETVVSLPLILPPSVVGYYLLLLLGRRGPLVRFFSVHIVFTWLAAVVASSVVALPLMVRASQAAIESVDPNVERAARTLGSPEWQVILDVTLPLARRGILAGLILAFARSLGEFGATLMVAGNIPGRTQTMPLAIYAAVQTNKMAEANLLVLIMTLVSFAVLWAVNRAQNKQL